MGTRADFYLGRGERLEWIGSCAYDGHEDTMQKWGIFGAKTEAEYLANVNLRLSENDGTRPRDGWPWPWETSHTTDRSYTFDGGVSYGSAWGQTWQTVEEYEARCAEAERRYQADEDELPELPKAAFPDMSERKAVATPGTQRSGVMVFGIRRSSPSEGDGT
jgi:hypothetical protein